jgi:hypothetical protein
MVNKNDKGQVVLDEATYNALISAQKYADQAAHRAEKQKAYRQKRYRNIKRILQEAKAKGIK